MQQMIIQPLHAGDDEPDYSVHLPVAWDSCIILFWTEHVTGLPRADICAC